MANDTLFNEAGDPVIDPNKNYHDELVGEGKKFADDNDLARGKAESDLFIAKLAAENASYREELTKRKSMEEFVNQIEQVRSKPPATDNNQNPNGQVPTLPSTVDIPSEVEKVIEARLARDRQSQNLEHVASVLEANLGPGFAQILAQRAKDLGVGLKFLDNLAQEQPKAFFALVGVPETPSRTQAPAPGARTNPGSLNGQKKNFAFYEQIRKTDPTRYNSLSNHKEMMEQLRVQGQEDFYS